MIAEHGADVFYRGEIAHAIASDMRARGGLLAAADLGAHTADWVEPITTRYRGVDLYEMPPSNQGIVALAYRAMVAATDELGLCETPIDFTGLLPPSLRRRRSSPWPCWSAGGGSGWPDAGPLPTAAGWGFRPWQPGPPAWRGQRRAWPRQPPA